MCGNVPIKSELGETVSRVCENLKHLLAFKIDCINETRGETLIVNNVNI